MKRSKKWSLILSILLLIPLPIYFLWTNSELWQKYLHLKLPQVSTPANLVFTWYLIAISTIIAVILIINLLVLLFWPVQRSFNLIPKHNGQVKITSKAIDGYILSSLVDLPYLNNAKVNSKLTKHHIKIYISGDLGSGENVANLLQAYLETVKTGLKQLLGIEQKPKIIIRFTNYHNSEKPSNRVQ